MRDERTKGIESKCRANSMEENLRLWQAMKDGTPEACHPHLINLSSMCPF